MRHFRTILDITIDETKALIELALQLKQERAAGKDRPRLPGRVLGLLFEKPSLRTRVSFETAMAHLGGSSIFLPGGEIGMGQRESVADVGRVISTYVDLLAVRTFSHTVIDELAANAACPIINALSDSSHPCQALADLCTIFEELGTFEGIRLAFVGDGNNVARSLAITAAYCGVDFVLSAPAGYEFEKDFIDNLAKLSLPGRFTYEPDAKRAVAGADIVYTDVWTSMGQEAQKAQRKKEFADYQVNAALMARAKPQAKFMHCLPAHRGEEVSADVIDGKASIVVNQAANRLHAQKALMLWLLTDAK